MNNLPHVTEVLKPWIAAFYSGYGPMEDAMRRGRRRHAAYAAHLLGAWAPLVDPRDEDALSSFTGWAEKYVKKVLGVELTLEDRGNGFVGTIDCIAELDMKTGMGIPVVAVLDWKPMTAGGPMTRAQIAAYDHLSRIANYPVNIAGFLCIDPAGGPAKMEWIDSKGIDFAGFLAALSAYRYFRGA